MQKKIIVYISIALILFGSGFFSGFRLHSSGAESIDTGIEGTQSGIDNSQSAVEEITGLSGEQSGRIDELEKLNSELTKKLEDREGKLSEAIDIINRFEIRQSGNNDIISNSTKRVENSIIITGSIEERLQNLVEEIENTKDPVNK